MTRREKILVGLMAAAVGLGALVLMGDLRQAGTPDVGSSTPPPLTQMLTRATAQVDAGASMARNRYVLAAAQEPWREALFVTEDRLLSANEASNGAASPLPSNVALVYEGYIETPHRQVAIINGIEYVVGDQLDQTQYIVRRIASDRVVIETPQERTLAVPLADGWEAETP